MSASLRKLKNVDYIENEDAFIDWPDDMLVKARKYYEKLDCDGDDDHHYTNQHLKYLGEKALSREEKRRFFQKLNPGDTFIAYPDEPSSTKEEGEESFEMEFVCFDGENVFVFTWDIIDVIEHNETRYTKGYRPNGEIREFRALSFPFDAIRRYEAKGKVANQIDIPDIIKSTISNDGAYSKEAIEKVEKKAEQTLAYLKSVENFLTEIYGLRDSKITVPKLEIPTDEFRRRGAVPTCFFEADFTLWEKKKFMQIIPCGKRGKVPSRKSNSWLGLTGNINRYISKTIGLCFLL